MTDITVKVGRCEFHMVKFLVAEVQVDLPQSEKIEVIYHERG